MASHFLLSIEQVNKFQEKPYSADAAAVNIEVFVRHVTFFTKVFIMDLHLNSSYSSSLRRSEK